MKSIAKMVAILVIGWQGFGCASTQDGGFSNSIKRGDGELVYLICEHRVPEGQTEPKKFCWEPKEGENPTGDREALVLYCENRQTKDSAEPERICKKQEGIVCEYRAEIGSHVPKLSCMSSDEKKLQTTRDQKELDRALMQKK